MKKFIQKNQSTIIKTTIICLAVAGLCFIGSRFISRDKPHYILHFDMNKTLIAEDTAGKKTSEDMIAEAIADRVKGKWDDTIKSDISYFSYVRNHLVPNPSSSPSVKLEQNKEIAKVLNFLKERNYSNYSDVVKEYNRALESLKNQKTQVFTSFYKVMDYLKREGISYTLVIRTFGSDAPEIVKELNDKMGTNFITEADFYKLEAGKLKGESIGLYELISEKGRNFAIQDDWKWWYKKNKQMWKAGKPYPTDLNNKKVVSLFFDDNAGHDPSQPERNIVSPYDAVSGAPIHPVELIEKNRLFPVDMYEALCDENYYINLFKRAFKNI